MKCPYCGKEMEKGIIPQERNGSFFWVPEKFPHLFSVPHNIRKAGGIVIKPMFSDGFMYAWICRSCGQGMFSFPPENK